VGGGAWGHEMTSLGCYPMCHLVKPNRKSANKRGRTNAKGGKGEIFWVCERAKVWRGPVQTSDYSPPSRPKEPEAGRQRCPGAEVKVGIHRGAKK